jgi:hypothetical protein
VESIDEFNDIVILEVEGEPMPVLEIDTSRICEIGEDVYAIGNPRGLEGTFSKGMVSGYRTVLGKKVMQITAPISPGSSGGPIIGTNGKAVGMAVSCVLDGQNLNFAVPANEIAACIKAHKVRAVTDLPRINLDIKREIAKESTELQIGLVKIRIGQDWKEAIATIREYYSVVMFPDGNAASIADTAGTDGRARTLAVIYSKDNRVSKTTRFLGETGDKEAVGLVKTLCARLREHEAKGSGSAVIRWHNDSITSPINRMVTRIFTVDVVFENYGLSLSASEGGENGVVLDEYYR